MNKESDADRKGMGPTQLPNDSVIFRTSERWAEIPTSQPQKYRAFSREVV